MSRYVFAEKLDRHSVTGAVVVTIAAVLSLVPLVLFLLHMSFTLAMPAYGRRMCRPQERKFLKSPMGFYVICLIASNFITAIGGALEAQWAVAGRIVQGPACTTQAFMIQLGGNAAALWTALISISALRAFILRAPLLPNWVIFLMITLLWIAMIVFDGVAPMIFAGHSNHFFYGIAGVWCWITPNYPLARLLTQYIWMWAWSLVSAISFILIFLCLRGTIKVKGDDQGPRKWTVWSPGSLQTPDPGSREYQGLVGAAGKAMCWFPISYITLTFPMSVARVAETFGFPVPAYAFFLAAVNHLLVGIINCIVYLAVRHSLKHAPVSDSREPTRDSSDLEKRRSADSFWYLPEKPISPIGEPTPSPWIPVPTTKEWVPPMTHRGSEEPSKPPKPPLEIAYAMTSGDDNPTGYRSSILSNAPPRHVPVSSKLAARTRSFHRPMESISTVTSTSTVREIGVKLSPVTEGGSTMETIRPQLGLPPAALVARRQSNPSPNIMSPAELGKLAETTVTPVQGSMHSETDPTTYVPRAISPDLNALLESSETLDHTGPPPPPRKTHKNKRTATPSVPVDVDESDQGSFSTSNSARPSLEAPSRRNSRPISLGDITARSGNPHAESMRTFWAAYEEPSPVVPHMPLPPDAESLRRDTMHTFWAAYEEPSRSSPDMPSDLASLKHDTALDAKGWRPSARSSEDFQLVDSSVFLKPSISAVGKAPAPKINVPAESTSALAGHRRSRSSTPTPSPPVLTPPPGTLRPAASAIARFGSPGILREGPTHHTPTPSDPAAAHTGDTGYRMPRSQPGYV